MPLRLAAAAALALLLVAPGCARRSAEPAPVSRAEPPAATQEESNSLFGLLYEIGPFYEDGPAVAGPAMGGGVLLAAPGYVLGLPAALVIWPFDSETAGQAPLATGFYCGAAGYCIVGGAAWTVKAVAWDAPYAFGRFVNLHVRSRKGQVDYLVRHLDGYDGGIYWHARRRLENLTGRCFYDGRQWTAWWAAHGDDFDSSMRLLPKPAAK